MPPHVLSIHAEPMLDPRGSSRRKPVSLAPRLPSLNGKTVLLFDNTQLTSQLAGYGPVFRWLSEYLQSEHRATCAYETRNLLTGAQGRTHHARRRDIAQRRAGRRYCAVQCRHHAAFVPVCRRARAARDTLRADVHGARISARRRHRIQLRSRSAHRRGPACHRRKGEVRKVRDREHRTRSRIGPDLRPGGFACSFPRTLFGPRPARG